MTGRTALIAGASGLVGGFLLKRLLASPAYAKVVSVCRRKSGIADPKLVEIVADFDRLDEALAGIGADDAFCTLGTTIRKAGSQDAFRRVDHDYVLAFARAARAAGAKRFLVVTAVGSSARSGIFYSRVKGEVEEALSALPFETLHIFRPGLILGERGERRPAEAAMMAAMPLLNSLLAGPLAVYRGISADTIAAAMVAAALGGKSGGIHSYRSMTVLARG